MLALRLQLDVKKVSTKLFPFSIMSLSITLLKHDLLKLLEWVCFFLNIQLHNYIKVEQVKHIK